MRWMFGFERILGWAIRPSRRRAFAVGLLGALLLSACGQRGPLYLPPPDTPKTQKTPPAPTPPADAPTAPGPR